jgi:integrase
MFDKFEREHTPGLGKRTKKDYTFGIRRLRQHFGAKDVRFVTRPEVLAYIEVPRGATARRKEVAVLSAAFNQAMDWEWVDGNPAANIGKVEPKKERRSEPLTLEAFENAKEVASQWQKSTGKKIALVMELALRTGKSQGDIIGCSWSHVNRKEQTILFRETHSNRVVRTVITPAINKLLERAKELCPNGETLISTKDGDRYTDEGFRALFQRFLVRKWDKTGNDRFNFHDIKRLSRKLSEELERTETTEPLDGFPQFGEGVRAESAINAPYYQIFFCLERMIRQQVAGTLEKAEGVHWWDSTRIAPDIHQYASELIGKEWDNATQRSPREIDYTTFGHLGHIITKNWDLFEKQFKSTSKQGILNLMNRLNMARGPIAHCCPLSSLEIEKLAVTIRNWFEILAT